jgi:hypothetical protein
VRENACLDRTQRFRDLVVGVQAVAEHGPFDAARGERLLRRVVARSDGRGIRRLGLRARCVDHPAHAGSLGRRDRRAVLRDAPPQIRRADQQQALGADECVAQRARLVEICAPNIRSACGEIGERVRRASREDHVARRALREHSFSDQPAELSRSAGDRESGCHERVSR